MTSLSLSLPFLAEQLSLIREISRNIAGAPLPTRNSAEPEAASAPRETERRVVEQGLASRRLQEESAAERSSTQDVSRSLEGLRRPHAPPARASALLPLAAVLQILQADDLAQRPEGEDRTHPHTAADLRLPRQTRMEGASQAARAAPSSPSENRPAASRQPEEFVALPAVRGAGGDFQDRVSQDADAPLPALTVSALFDAETTPLPEKAMPVHSAPTGPESADPAQDVGAPAELTSAEPLIDDQVPNEASLPPIEHDSADVIAQESPRQGPEAVSVGPTTSGEPDLPAMSDAFETGSEPSAAYLTTQHETLAAGGEAASHGEAAKAEAPREGHIQPSLADAVHSHAPEGVDRAVITAEAAWERQAQPSAGAGVHFPAAEGADWTAVTERSLAALGFAAFDQVASGPLAERAGVIASFILNAHFVPGWPPPRPISALETETLLRRLGATDLKPALTADEVEKLLYLSKLGLLPGQLARLLKAIANRPLRCKILDALAVLLTNMGAALGILREELAALADELSAREAVAVEARPGGSRRRIDLR